MSHVENMRSVKNYVGPLGTLPPTTLGEFTFKRALTEIDNGNLEALGHMYFERKDYEIISWTNGEVYRDGKPLISDGKVHFGVDSIYTESLTDDELELVEIELVEKLEEAIAGVGFIEEWEYDKDKGQLNKDIKYLSLLNVKRDSWDGSVRGLQFLFTFPVGKFSKRFVSADGLIKKEVEYDVLFNRDFWVGEEGQVVFGMARTPFADGFIEASDRYAMLLDMIQGVKTGALSIYNYNPIDFRSDRLSKAVNADFFKAAVVQDTVYMENLETGELEEEVVSYELTMEDVVGFRFYEDWYIDPDHFGMYKRVKGVVLLMENFDPVTGENRGTKPYVPYYIKLNSKM